MASRPTFESTYMNVNKLPKLSEIIDKRNLSRNYAGTVTNQNYIDSIRRYTDKAYTILIKIHNQINTVKVDVKLVESAERELKELKEYAKCKDCIVPKSLCGKSAQDKASKKIAKYVQMLESDKEKLVQLHHEYYRASSEAIDIYLYKLHKPYF